MELLVLSACGLVANQYMRLKGKSTVSQAPEESKSVQQFPHQQYEQQQHQQYEQQQQPQQYEQQQQHQQYEQQTALRLIGAPTAPTAPTNATRPSAAPIPLGVRTLKTDNTGDVGDDDARFSEQFSHPQDPNPSVSAKPWMRMANAPYKPKEEIVSEIPGPQDVFGRNMNTRIKKMESDFASSTVPVTSEKQFDRPVEQIATGNGSAVGFHIGAGRRYHKFILNDQPTIESEGGPRGAFAGASGQHVKGDYRTVTQRASMTNHESFGPPVAVGVPQSSTPVPSFEISPSHLEGYRLDDHMAKGVRAPVQASASIDNVAFRGAHDERFDVLHTSLVTGGERFATGASGYRDAKIHVPLNNDPVATYDQRVVPNFKIAKASDYQDQQVTARQMMIPEMSQNVSALRKDSKPPVSATIANKKSSSVIDTGTVQSGAGARNSTGLHVTFDPASFTTPAERNVVVAEKTALVSTGASAAHSVGSSNSAPSSSSLFRTTQSMSELVGTPFIPGAGTKRASGLEAMHEATDTRLSEMESSGIRQGLNKFASSVAATATASASSSSSEQTRERGDVFKKSERAPILVTPGMLGTNRVGAANLDVHGMISRRGLGDDVDVNVMNSLLPPPPSSSYSPSRHNPRKTHKPSSRSKEKSKTTRDRKLGDVLNARLGSSPAMKKLLKNPYSLPAASRLSAL